MRIEHLKYLLEINRLHSISEAADTLYVCQATLSRTVKSLESELGFTIFTRSRKGVVLTPEGEAALSIAEEICRAYDGITEIGRETNATRLPVSVISSPTILSALALPVSRMFAELDSGCSLVFHGVTGNAVYDSIINNEAHIGLTYYSQEQLNTMKAVAEKYRIKIKALFRDRFHIVARKDSPLANAAELYIEELHGQSFATLTYYQLAEASLWFMKNMPADCHCTSYSNVSLLKQAVVEYDMLGILSGYSAFYGSSASNDALTAIPLVRPHDDNGMFLCLVCQDAASLRPIEKLLINSIEDYFSKLKA